MVEEYGLQSPNLEPAFYKSTANQSFSPLSGVSLSNMAHSTYPYSSQDISPWMTNSSLMDYRFFPPNNLKYPQMGNGSFSPSLLCNQLVNSHPNHIGCLTESAFSNLYGKHSSINQYQLFNNSVSTSCNNSNFNPHRSSLRFTFDENPDKPKKPHIKKPLNAFMLFMKEMRSKVVAECTLKESAAINQILGRKWHSLSREEQAKYYEMARKEKELHHQLYPGWSARDNYASHVKKKKKRQTLHMCSSSKIIKEVNKKDKNARENNSNHSSWTKSSGTGDQQNQSNQCLSDGNFNTKSFLPTESQKLHTSGCNYISSVMSSLACPSFSIFPPTSHTSIGAEMEAYNFSYAASSFQNPLCQPSLTYPSQAPTIFDHPISQTIKLEPPSERPE